MCEAFQPDIVPAAGHEIHTNKKIKVRPIKYFGQDVSQIRYSNAKAIPALTLT